MNARTPGQPHRRKFLGTTLAAAAGTSGWFSSRQVARSNSPNEKLNVACIGSANRAAEDIKGVAHEEVVCLCDVDRKYLERKHQEFPDAALFADYREMLDKEQERIDAVVVGITDHHHAPATIRAIRAGKHVYCEKPLTHTVHEARLIAEAAQAAGVATQLGTQIHAEDNYRRVVEIVRAGTIGDITDVHVWVGKGWGGGERPDKAEQPPAHLDWDLWLGPAPERPYVTGLYHPANWRRWWDFGQGTLGDMGCHYMDLPFWALDLRHPTEVAAEGPEVHPETAPLGMKVRYQFPAGPHNASPLSMTWYDSKLAPTKVAGQRVKPNGGVMFIGSEGMLFADYFSYRLFPQEKFTGFIAPPKTIPDSIGHHREWLKACRDGSPTTCNFQYSGRLTETVLLGNVAFRSGTKFQWDADKLQADSADAQQFVSKEYRAGWEVELEPAAV